MSRTRHAVRIAAALSAGALLLGACSSSSSGGTSASGTTPAGSSNNATNSNLPSWCGPKKITLGLTDGFGDNSWRIVTTASAKDEIKKCPNVTQFFYADGQGNTQKAISDIQGMVAKGVKALVVFPDAGKAILPALRSAYQAGVVTVPYRVSPGGTAGQDYNVFIGTNFVQAGVDWGNWIKKVLPNGGNVLMLSGPPGNSQGVDENKGLHQVLDPTGKYHFIGQQPFVVTNWDPSLTQQVLTAAIAKYPKIDVIVHDFGPTLVSSLPLFPKSGRPIPALATSDGNSLGCFWHQSQSANPFKMMTVSTQNDHARLAIDWAVALATGGQKPSSSVFPNTIFEDSTTGKPHPVECRKSLSPDIYLSAELSPAVQNSLVK
jgi:ribose transport system substrate-binding protein